MKVNIFKSVYDFMNHYEKTVSKVVQFIGHIPIKEMFKPGFTIFVIEEYNGFGELYVLETYFKEEDCIYHLWGILNLPWCKEYLQKFKDSQKPYTEEGLKDDLRKQVLEVIDNDWDIEDYMEFIDFWRCKEDNDA